MKKNVFVFPCGSEIGLEIYKSMSLSTHVNLVGGSSVDDHGIFIYPSHVSNIPFVDDDNFISAINKIIEEYSIDFIFPAHDSVLLKLSEAEFQGKLSCPVIASPYDTCDIARSKRKTYESLKNVVNVPREFALRELHDDLFPLFLKPDVGQGSKGTFKVHSEAEIRFYMAKDPTLMILEYLPGDEYTIDCFTDSTGNLLVSEPRVRQRILNGISVNSIAVTDNQKFKELALKINTSLVFEGAWFFQLKENSQGELCLLEIAPRIAGTMGLIRGRGINLPLLNVFNKLGFGVSATLNKYELVIDRALENKYKHNIAYDHVYLDFDDLVIFEEKVNPSIIAFVYQCVNKGKQVHLLTKHKANLDRTLEKYRLSHLFNEVLWIRPTDEKSDHIKHHNAIFIDDSFQERKDVQDRHGIPVFDGHMIEALMEKF